MEGTNTADASDQQRLAVEVLELGESLFEAALEGYELQATEDDAGESYPVEEIRAAAEQFFTALRLLLNVEA